MQSGTSKYVISADTAALIDAYKALGDIQFNVNDTLGIKYMESELMATAFNKALANARNELATLIGKNVANNADRLNNTII